MISMFSSMSGGSANMGMAAESAAPNATSLDQSVNQELNDQVGLLLEQLLPSTKEIAKILRQNNFNVTADDKLLIDVN